MSNYDFSTLNDKDFEDIVCDLLSAELKIPFQSFKEGKDKGIDLRYSTKDNENEIVVQVKHYLKTGKSGLNAKLKTSELKKANSLNVSRYIIVTSIALNPEDKAKILDYLSPYILSTQDIYGKNELNRALTRHKHIEKKHFKLWLTNTTILNRIIHNGILGRSEFFETKIKKNIGLFVKNISFDIALEILKNEKILLITGIPGVGKTTLSYILSYYFLAKKFDLIFCQDDFKEAETVFGDPKEKQIFFFDDFLGDSYFDIKNGKNKTISDFIERVKISKNKFIILTTRTTILNQAKNYHEKIDRISFNSKNIELKIENYSNLDKAKILYNHLRINNIPLDLIKQLIDDKNYLKIINHDNYNPRLLEFITNLEHFDNNVKYIDFCLDNLDNPKKVWEKPFKNQLNDDERNFLFCLLSSSKNVNLNDLEKLVDEKNKCDIKNQNRIIPTNSFMDSYKNLLNGFIKATTDSKNNISIDFINPSLKDYLINYFNSNTTERRKFYQSFQFIEQFDTFFKNRSFLDSKESLKFSFEDLKKTFEFIKSNEIKSLRTKNQNSIYLLIVFFLDNHNYTFFKEDQITDLEEFYLSLFEKINWKGLDSNIKFFNGLYYVFENIESESPLINYFRKTFFEILQLLLLEIEEENDLSRLFSLEDKFKIDIYEILKQSDKLDVLKETLNRIYDHQADEFYDYRSPEIFEEIDFNRLVDNTWDLQFKLSSLYFKDNDLDFEYNPFEERGFAQICDDNMEMQFDASNDWEAERENNFTSNHNEAEIDNLFDRFNYL